MRKAFSFYASYWEQIKLLNDKQKLEIINIICGVQFLEVNINDINPKDPIVNLVWSGIKHSVSASLDGYIAKQKGLGQSLQHPLSRGVETPCQEEEEKEEEKEQVKEEVKGKAIPTFEEFKIYALSKKKSLDVFHLKTKYDAWVENDWKDGNDNKIKNWKSKLNNTIPYIKEVQNKKMVF